MTDSTNNVEILPPESTADTPLAQAREMARTSMAQAMADMRAAHQAARNDIDTAFGALTVPEGLPPDAGTEYQAMAAQMRQELTSQMQTRTVQLADAIQRMAFGHIAEAGAAVANLRRASKTKSGG